MQVENEIKNKIINWLNEEITVSKINDFISITTPFCDRNNDYLQIYVKVEDNDKVYLTDDGYIINNLIDAGIDVSTNKRKKILEQICLRSGVTLEDNKLSIEGKMERLPDYKFMLMQAMLNVDDMFMLSKSQVTSIFLEDFKKYLDINEINYSENISFIGKSGYTHTYDYMFQRTKRMPERLCKAINHIDKTKMESIIFEWNDTLESRRSSGSILIIIINDDNKVDKGIIDSFEKYDVKTIKWSERNEKCNKELLAS